MKTGVYFYDLKNWDRVFGEPERQAISKMVRIPQVLVTRDNWTQHRDLLERAELLVSTWGGPVLHEEMLAALPNLKAYFYAAGEMSHLMTDAAWDRGIRITTAAAANAIPVAEFTLAQIILSLKRSWEYMARAKAHAPELWGQNKSLPGLYGSTVGLVSIGMISRTLIRLLQPFDVRVQATCAHTSPAEARALGIELVNLETLFSSSDVVSLHLRNTPNNKGIINRALLARMKPQSSLINTARGAVLNQADLIAFLRERADVYACIDVTDPEPPPADCPLLQLPNVVLTPHLAGSMDIESRRLGNFIADELRRYLAGEALKGEVTREMMRAVA